MTRTDAELLIASRDDAAAFRELYDRWADRLLAYFYRRVLDAEVAGDLLAETFAVAFERRRRFRDVGAPGAAWLYGIANKELAHWFRRQAVERKAIRRLAIEVPPLDDESIARIEALAEMDTYRGELAAALDRIGPGERDAVQLRVVEEMGYAEIASRLDCTEAAVRVRVHRGLARLNRLLEVASRARSGFVKALGDELERKIAARRGRIRRRIVIGGLGFAIAATGVAAASGVFTGTPEQLASNAVGCFERADLDNSSAGIVSTGDETPIETCRRALKTDRPLVACAGEAVFVFPGRPGTCERLGLEPLPPEYDTARARVLVLERELAALEASADCVPLDEFAERAQGVLDRLGWAGWRAHVRDDLGRGPCGSALGYNGDGSRSIEGTLIADERYLIVMPGPRRSTLDLLDGPGVRVMDASGDRCYDVEGIKQLVRDRLPAGGRRLSFHTGTRPEGTGIMGSRGERLEAGCAIIVGFMPTPDDRGIVVEIWR